MKKIAVILLMLTGVSLQAQTDSLYHVAFILPFNAEHTYFRLEEFLDATDVTIANKVRISEESTLALEFYRGAKIAIEQHQNDKKMQWHFFDNSSSDSLTAALLLNPVFKKMHVIVGSAGSADAAKVAEFCRVNKIINIQPFVPRKSLGHYNNYHLKLVPTIETHVDNMFLSIVDSFAGANVIIYTPGSDINLSIAQRFDSLFTNYNKSAAKKFNVVFINTKDMLVNGKKTTAAEQLKTGQKNVWILTSFDENSVSGSFRVMYENRNKYDIAVYGMPNWLNLENMRLDYLNHFNVRISDAYYFDSTAVLSRTFAENFAASYKLPVNRNSCMGYDVVNFISTALQQHGNEMLDKLPSSRYKGAGYVFDIHQNKSVDGLINYYETKHANVFMLRDYTLQKIW